jgi:type I restriction enzyme, S subunit
MMGWDMVRLGDVAKISKGKKYVISKVGVRYINIEDLHGNTELVFTNEKGVPCTKNDVLIAWDGANAGKVGIGLEGVIGSTIAKMEVIDKRLSPQFFYWFLSSSFEQIKRQRTGATIPHVNGGHLRDLLIPLPPLATQQKIAAILDAADALRRKDKALLGKYDELAQAIFVDMFGDPVRNEMGWEVKRLGEVCEKIQIGPFGTQLHASDYIADGVPVINPMHIQDKKIQANRKYSISKQKVAELPEYLMKSGDVILGRRGEMGRAALVGSGEEGFLCGTGSLFLTPIKDQLNSEFLCDFLTSNQIKLKLERESSGTTMMNLNKDVLNSLQIPLPNIEVQKKYSQAKIESARGLELVKQQAQASDTLFHSLLDRAFKGELVR